jgi:hypothetical protein
MCRGDSTISAPFSSPFPAHRRQRPDPVRRHRGGFGLRAARTVAVVCLIVPVVLGCRTSGTDVERVFGWLPKRSFDSIECSNLTAARESLGLAAINHTSSVEDKLAYFKKLDRFTFSTGEYSFLVSNKTPLGFDPSDFSVTVVARTPSYSLTLVSGDFKADTIRERLLAAGYRSQSYRDREIYSLPWSDAPREGGLSLAFANLVFVEPDVIVSAPTEQLLEDYLDWIAVGTMGEDPIVMGLVETLKDQSSFYISQPVRTEELYGEDSLFIRSPEDWGLPGYRLSPYTCFAFAISPAADRQRQSLTLLVLYPDEASAENDATPLTEGLKRGRSLSRLVPFSDLLTVTKVTAHRGVLTALIESRNDFDLKLLIRLTDLPFLVY